MKLSPEAQAFRAKIDAEQSDWPDELKEAAVWLRCELDRMLYKNWRETAGPEHLRRCYELFMLLYAEFSRKG